MNNSSSASMPNGKADSVIMFLHVVGLAPVAFIAKLVSK